MLSRQMNARDLILVGVSAALIGGAVVRVVGPGTEPTRRISVEAMEIRSAPIRSGESLVQEVSWTPPDDVYIVGWTPDPGAPTAQPEMHLLSDKTTIFLQRGVVDGPKPVFFPAGTGFLLTKERSLKLRLQMTNSGADGETKGARALIYFHPVVWR
jgi:hypothetical protein